MRNKRITALPPFVGIEAVPFAAADDSASDTQACGYGGCPTPTPSLIPTPTPPPLQGPVIVPFMTLELPDRATENFGEDAINLGDVNGDGFVHLLTGKSGPGGPADPPTTCSVNETFESADGG